MAEVVGWKMHRLSDGAELQTWGGVWGSCPMFPNPLFLPNGDHVHAGSPNVQYADYIVTPWLMDAPPAVPVQQVQDNLDINKMLAALIAKSEAQDATINALRSSLADLAKEAVKPA